MLPEIEPAARHWQRVTDYLVEVTRAVEPSQWGEPSPYRGWSYRDLLVHLATGYVVRISWLESSIEGGGPAPYIDADTANAARVEEHRETRVEKLIEEMVATRGRILELMGRLQPEHLDFGIERTGPPPRTERLGDFLSDMSAHDIEHAEELQQVASRRVLAPDPLP